MSMIYFLHRTAVLKRTVRKRTVWDHTVHGAEKPGAETWCFLSKRLPMMDYIDDTVIPTRRHSASAADDNHAYIDSYLFKLENLERMNVCFTSYHHKKAYQRLQLKTDYFYECDYNRIRLVMLMMIISDDELSVLAGSMATSHTTM